MENFWLQTIDAKVSFKGSVQEVCTTIDGAGIESLDIGNTEWVGMPRSEVMSFMIKQEQNGCGTVFDAKL